ncbi:helix-turn-helix domain-containing protein [Clostridium sp. CS001]|uniref:helix-turn-helix domain-containing protein n=1 Tax=Clostridium sp. CS001 TaxID=2880648 RepID=UPI001CF10D67|nr:helix-turn-helix domain-containing protein [Clostridium sp. CS001]MCB2289652.1 helix-turn-helix domain-containing protein [Clostridium sp. CS001]
MKNTVSEQVRFIPDNQLINEVITLQEASEILDCDDSTLRKQVLNGKFKDGEYRKAKGVILFNKNVILQLKERK